MHTMKYDCAMKRDERLVHANWMTLEISEKSQSEQSAYYTGPFI